MISSEIRANSRKSLEGKWGKCALIMLCYFAISALKSLILMLIPVIGIIIDLVISIPISYGLVISFIKLKRGEELEYIDFIKDGFSQFGEILRVYWQIFWKLKGAFILAFISYVFIAIFAILIFLRILTGGFFSSEFGGFTTTVGFIGIVSVLLTTIYLITKGLFYILSSYILYDNPNMSTKEILEESKRVMEGNRARFIGLYLTFIGWAILSLLTCGIGLLWLLPYLHIATIYFYEDLTSNIFEENNPISEQD